MTKGDWHLKLKKVIISYMSVAPILEIVLNPDSINKPFLFFTNLKGYSIFYKECFIQQYKKGEKGQKNSRRRFVRGLGEFKTYAGHELKNLPLCKSMGGNIDSILKRSNNDLLMFPFKLKPNWKIKLDPNIFNSKDVQTQCMALVKMYAFGMISYEIRIRMKSDQGIDLEELIKMMSSVKDRDVLITNKGKFNALSIIKKIDETIRKDIIDKEFVPNETEFSKIHRILSINSADSTLDPEKNRKELAALVGLMLQWNKLSKHYIKTHLGRSLAGIFEDQFFFFHPSCTIIYPANPATKPKFNAYIRKCLRTNFTSIVETATIQRQFADSMEKFLQKALDKSPYTPKQEEEFRILLDRIKTAENLLINEYFDNYFVGAHQDFFHIIQEMIGLKKITKKSLNKLNNFKKEVLKGRAITEMINILFLSSNPDGTTQLDLNTEFNAIEDEIDKSKFRDNFNLKQRFELKPSEIAYQFLKNNPVIVHFSGHGNRAGEIILQNEKTGKAQPIDIEAIERLFSTLKDNIRCVVLNACFTKLQAKLISRHIDCVIGMTNAIGDESAIKFAQGFYRGIGWGKDLATAFELGCGEIDLHNLEDEDVPKIIWKNDIPQKIVLT